MFFVRTVLLLLILLHASSARAEPQSPRRLAVLPTIVAGPHGETTPSEIHEYVAPTLSMRVGIELVSYNEVFVDGVRPLAHEVRDCGSDTSCIAISLKKQKIFLGLRVVVNFAIDPPLVTWNLFESETETVLGESLAEIEPGGSLDETLEEGTASLIEESGFRIAGRIIAKVSPAGAKLKLGEGLPPDLSNPLSFTVVPGRYDLSATKEGYLPERTSVVAISGEKTEVALALAEEESILSSPWLWVVIGVAVAGTATAVVLATDPFGGEERACVCITTANGPCGTCI